MLTFILTMKTSENTAKPPSSTLLAIITSRVRTCPVSSARVYNIFFIHYSEMSAESWNEIANVFSTSW